MRTAFCLLLGITLAFTRVCPAAEETGSVTQVVDGDTFHLADGRSVRCLGIDAPEKGDAHAEEATQVLNQWVGGKQVRLELGRPTHDRDGRLLAYVFVGKTLVNAEVVRQGAAHVRRPVLAKYRKMLLEAQEEARAAAKGIWSKAAEVKLVVAQVHARPARGDVPSLNNEYIVLENRGDRALDMTGWSISDEANHRYLLPNFALPAHGKVTLRTGMGKNTETDLFWGNRVAVWNDGGDTIFIKDASGNLVLVYLY